MGKHTQPDPSHSTSLLDGSGPEQLHRALAWALHSRLFASLQVHGNTTWTPPGLIVLTLFWVWSECPTLTGAFTQASQLCVGLFGRLVLKSYAGLSAALVTWTPRLLPLLSKRLRQRMEDIAGDHWRIGSWLPLAVDGSRTTTPRTRANERAFHPPRYGRGKKARSRSQWKNKRRRKQKLTPPAPQMWMTLLWHMGLKMPWAWKLGPSNASEREHLVKLLETEEFPAKTLFCADAGFVGYDLWRSIADRGHHFLIRVGSNVRLLRGLGEVRRRGDFVHFWPKKIREKGQPPMVLRLLSFQVGRRVMFAVTNVLGERDLTGPQARRLYEQRWGVEVQFRSLKQTFGRRKLHSRTPAMAQIELHWSILGLWLIQLLAAAEQIPAGIAPERGSVSVAVQVVRDAMRGGRSGPVRSRLREAVKDSYRRRGSKAARYRPKKKDKPSAGRPKIDDPRDEERRKYQRLTELKRNP
jgi:Transposase DDE domain